MPIVQKEGTEGGRDREHDGVIEDAPRSSKGIFAREKKSETKKTKRYTGYASLSHTSVVVTMRMVQC